MPRLFHAPAHRLRVSCYKGVTRAAGGLRYDTGRGRYDTLGEDVEHPVERIDLDDLGKVALENVVIRALPGGGRLSAAFFQPGRELKLIAARPS